MLRTLTSALPGGPSIVVLDELPWLAGQDETFDASLQVAWDRLPARGRGYPALIPGRAGSSP